MKQSVEEAAKRYADKMYNPADRGVLHKETQKDFIAGAKWAEKNKANSKAMCLRDKTKECNLCHECDVNVLNPSY
jgi:cytochrome c551/c552